MSPPIRVLHVDDEPDVADLTATFLVREDEGMTVETETGGADALDRLAADDFDCVVSDYEMPGMDGLELLDAIRAEYPELPFILFTGEGSEAIASDAIAVGVTDYLQKGSGTEQYELLATRIRNAVEHARAEQARQRHLEAIETAREGISILDSDGDFIYVNQAYADLYGYDPAEMVGEHWALTYPDDEVEMARTEVLTTVEAEGYWHGETTGLRADGTTFPEDHVVSRTDQGDLVCTVRDSSDRRDRQAELRLKDRVLDEAPIGVTIAEPGVEDNPLLYVNDEFERLTGYDADEILGDDCRFLQGDRTSEHPVAAMQAAIDAVEPVTVELRNYRRDGTEFWNRITISPLTDADGTVQNWVGFQEDVTEPKERERERAALEQGVDQIGVGIANYDDWGRIRYANEAYARLVGTTSEELIGSHVWELNPEFDPDRFEDYWNSYDPGETRVHETVHERFDTGRKVAVRTTTTRVRIDDATYHIGTISDITEQKAHEAQLRREVERLDKFAGIVSHDLRNPLNVAQGHLGLIAEECDTDHERIDTVRNALERMNELITDTLTLARQGRTVNETEPTALGRIARESWRNTDTGGAVLDVPDELTIHTDPERFRSVLENLFRNSVEHSPTGSRTESDDSVEHSSTSNRAEPDDSAEHASDDVTVTVGALPDRAGFYVEDDGPGIPDTDRDDVFEAGYSTATGSSGFGLAIVTEIAEAHGWTVGVTDATDGGARFEFTGVAVGN